MQKHQRCSEGIPKKSPSHTKRETGSNSKIPSSACGGRLGWGWKMMGQTQAIGFFQRLPPHPVPPPAKAEEGFFSRCVFVALPSSKARINARPFPRCRLSATKQGTKPRAMLGQGADLFGNLAAGAVYCKAFRRGRGFCVAVRKRKITFVQPVIHSRLGNYIHVKKEA